MKSSEFTRLSKSILPTHYKLEISPNLVKFDFSGHVIIDLIIKEKTYSIELHSLGLELSSIILIDENGDEISLDRTETVGINESIVFHFQRSIQPGCFKLHIKFNGIINENLTGFYRTPCLLNDGSMGYGAATQFESIYARKAFPCFDEPDFKATFEITIVAPRDKTVLSNMPIKSIEKNESEANLAKFHFETTPKISTYLVAYAIGEYDFVEEVSSNGCLIRVYTPLRKKEMGRFSLDIALKALSFFEDYFGIKYPIVKLDLIALNAVEIEAMENMGLLTFKESLLLIDSKNYSIQSKLTVGLVVAHEIAHQWFGNMTTMEWWTDLWLNEGFANWVQCLCINHCFPEWNIWNYYANDDLSRAYELDSLKSSHPIEVPIEDPAQINEVFDAISYCKGSAILRMLNDYIGQKDFIRGVRNYLNEFRYKNATSEDLWNHIDLVSGDKQVKSLMQVWTKKQGFPLIQVSVRLNAENNHTMLLLKQERFFKTGHLSSSSNLDETIWNVPISITTKSAYPNVRKFFLLKTKESQVDLGFVEPNDWIKINLDYIGFYITQYSREMFEKILDQLEISTPEFCSPLDRFGLINDAFYLCWCEKMSGYDFLRLLDKFKNEADTNVWIMILKKIHILLKLFSGTRLQIQFRDFVRNLLEKITNSLRLDANVDSDENDLVRLLKEHVFYMQAKLNNHSLWEFSKKFLKDYSRKMPADLQKAILTSILNDDNKETIDYCIELYKRSETPEEKEKIALILGEVSNQESIEQVLSFAISPLVTSEETVFIIIAVASNSTSADSARMAWEFLKRNWNFIYKRYSDSVLLGRLLKNLIQNFSSLDAIADILNFFEKNPAPHALNSIQQGLESIRSNELFIKNQLDQFEKYFQN